jgi:hypothetical protein
MSADELKKTLTARYVKNKNTLEDGSDLESALVACCNAEIVAWSGLKVPVLQAFAKRFGLSPHGHKNDIAKRLKAFCKTEPFS